MLLEIVFEYSSLYLQNVPYILSILFKKLGASYFAFEFCLRVEIFFVQEHILHRAEVKMLNNMSGRNL